MKNARTVKLGLIQMSMTDSHDKNLKKAQNLIAEAASRGANMIALPELFSSLYFCRNEKDDDAFKHAEKINGYTNTALAACAKQHEIVLIGGSIFEKTDDEQYFNTSAVFGPEGEMLGTYRKTHIPHDPGFYEQNYFEKGDTGVRVFDTPLGKIAVLICYDQWFPEAARIAALKGAEILFYPTAIGDPKLPPIDAAIPEDFETMWRSVQIGHAAANNVYVATINRVGTEGKTTFWGGSFVASPTATLLAKADDREQIVYADCDLSYVKKVQDAWRLLLERRPEMYGDLAS